MEKLQHQYGAEVLADALQVSPSGFAAHAHKAQRPRRRQDAQLRPLIAQSFAKSRHTYGSPRVRLDLQDLGHRCGKSRVARLMREQQLRPKQKRRFRPRTTDSRGTVTRSPRTGWPRYRRQSNRGKSGKATLLTSKLPKAGSIWLLPWMPAHGAVSLITAAKIS